jgi:hypothetical protein
MPLAEEEQKHLTAAEGYLELGMFIEANDELELIDPYCRHLPMIDDMRLSSGSRSRDLKKP